MAAEPQTASMDPDEIVTAFEEHGASEIKTELGVSGWVPNENVDDLLDAVDDAQAMYGDDMETFVTTLQ